MGEGFPEKKEKNKSLSDIGRAALLGAAMLGAVGAADTKEAHAQTSASHEQVEGYDVAKEAGALIGRIAQMDVDIDDARGRHTLKQKIQTQLDSFTLSLDQRLPYGTAVNGFVTMQSRAKAYEVALDAAVRAEMNDASLKDNPAFTILNTMLDQGLASKPGSAKETSQQKIAPQPSPEAEIRRNKTKDW